MLAKSLVMEEVERSVPYKSKAMISFGAILMDAEGGCVNYRKASKQWIFWDESY